jgi:hypothetical protein
VRRLLIAIAVAFLGASPALAKPKVAVTPVGGDPDDKMGAVVREALDGQLVVVDPKDVERAMSKLGLAGALEESDAQRLGQKLDAAVVVQGKLGRAGPRKTVRLTVWVRGKKPSDFNVQYKTAASEKFRDVMRDALLKRIGSVSDLDEDEKPKKKLADGDEDEKPKKKLADDDDEKPRKKKLADGDDADEKPKKKKLADGDDADEKPKKKTDGDDEKPKKKKKVATADDDDKPKVRKRKRGGEGDGDGEGVREQPARPLPVGRVDAGLFYGARYLTYKVGSGSTDKPPKLFTPAPAGHIEGELYPFALANRKSSLAGLGIFGEFAKTLVLSINVPGTMGKSVTIDQSHYGIGALYRIGIGKAAISGGVAYTRRRYIADRKPLQAPAQLDTPDVDYAGISPMLGARAQVGAKLSLFAEIDVMLALSAGGITESGSYGPGDVFGIGGNSGVDIALGKQVGLRIAGGYNQINLSFNGTGTMASARKVSGATDRDFGATATLAAWF